MQNCVRLPQSTSFEMALIKLYKKLSCEHFSTKPTFAYKREKMGQIATNLMTCDDWNVMIRHVKKHKVDVIQLKTDDKVSFTPCYHAIIIKLT